MYIKFCRSYGEDKKDEAKETLSSKLSVELERERGKQSEGKTGLYRAVCLVLALICLVLLLVIIFLCVKLQTGSADCGDAATCNYQQCRTLFPGTVKVCPNNCPDGWLEFSGSCFHLSTTRLSWDMSQRNCSARGGSLVVISNPGIQHFLAQQGMRLSYWIGLRRSEDEWSWVNNTPLEKSYWFDNPTHGDCGLFVGSRPHDKNWGKEPCQSATYYICQM